jgi:hypothetical protein
VIFKRNSTDGALSPLKYLLWLLRREFSIDDRIGDLLLTVLEQSIKSSVSGIVVRDSTRKYSV